MQGSHSGFARDCRSCYPGSIPGPCLENIENLINFILLLKVMERKMIKIPVEVYEALKEEIEILSNKEMREAIEESEKAEKDGVKGWELKY